MKAFNSIFSDVNQIAILFSIYAIESIWLIIVSLCYSGFISILFCCIISLSLVYEWPLLKEGIPTAFSNEIAHKSVVEYSLKSLICFCLTSFYGGKLLQGYSIKLVINAFLLSLSTFFMTHNHALLCLIIANFGIITYSVCITYIFQSEIFILIAGEVFLLFFLLRLFKQSERRKLAMKQKVLKEFLLDFPEAIIILNPENEVKFKSQEVYSLFEGTKDFNKTPFIEFAENIVETGNANSSLESNIKQFRKDVESTYQNKLQWTQDYYINTKESSNDVHGQNKKYIIITISWMKEPLIESDTPSIICNDIILLFKDTSDKSALKEQIIAENMKSVLISTMSHELRTPINGIIGILNMISDRIPCEILEWWKAGYISAQLLLNTVNCMLDFSLLETNKFTIHPANVDLRALFSELVIFFEDIITKEKVSITFKVANDIPDNIRTDYNRLKQVLINLLSNAASFTFNGSISLEAATHDQHEIEIFVIDTGVGMSKKKIRGLFKMFGNIEDNSPVSACQQAGLGLTVSNQIVKQLGGIMGVDSKEKEGTKFHFTIKNIIETPKILPKPGRNASQSKAMMEGEMSLLLNAKPELRRSAIKSIFMRNSVVNQSNFALNLVPMIPDMATFSEVHKKKRKSSRLKLSQASNSNSDSDSVSENKSISQELKLSTDITESVKIIQRVVSRQSNNVDFRGNRRSNDSSLAKKANLKENKIIKDFEILVVDDNSINRLVLSGMLKNLGYLPKEACNGQEACNLVFSSDKKFDIILMDVQMPLMDGIEATYKIREKYDKVKLPIIAVTALCSELELQKCIDAGMNGTIAKPLSLNDIKGIMEKYRVI